MSDRKKERERFLEDLLACWALHVPPAYNGLLAGAGWTWDETRQGYQSRTGTWVDGADLDALARSFMISCEIGMEDETIKLLPSVHEWKPRIKEDAKSELFLLAMLASGGFDELDEKQYAAIDGEESTDEQPGYGLKDIANRLQKFADELTEGNAGSKKQIVNRAGLYARSGWIVYQECRRISHREAKDGQGRSVFLFERNVLDDGAQHCQGTIELVGCPELTELGWVPIGTLPPPGLGRACGANCRCSLQYALVPPDDGLGPQGN